MDDIQRVPPASPMPTGPPLNPSGEVNVPVRDVKLPVRPISFGEPAARPLPPQRSINTDPVTTPSVPTPALSAEPLPTAKIDPAPTPDHKSGGPHLVVIVVAVLVMIALSVAIIFVYKQRNSSSIKSSNSSENEQTGTQPASVADVDDTNKVIDDNLDNVDSDKDFSSGELSDATLGL